MSELVTDYMERVAPFRLRLEIRLHLWRCEACRRYFDQVRQTAVLLGSRRLGTPARGTEQSLLAAARGQRQRDP
jgi:predicted anti-sigma-YlaC factor YlaD